MFRKIIIILIITASLQACSKNKKVQYEFENKKVDPYQLYEEGFDAFEKGDYFFANKKFSEAELNFEIVEYAAKSSIMSSYSLYGINFYDEALENLERYIKKYPADKNIIYAHYLNAIIYYEQISDEKKDLKPLLQANEKIDFFLKKYPDTDYYLDLKFKKDLIQNQLAAKELYVAKYYISTQKWVPAINRLKIIVEKHQETIFIEEALHRLVEIYHYLGIDSESKKYAKILGYNYNSSRWFEKSYKILNKDYKIKKRDKNKKKDDSFFKKILKKIK
mgnify:CR=1 FL=1